MTYDILRTEDRYETIVEKNLDKTTAESKLRHYQRIYHIAKFKIIKHE